MRSKRELEREIKTLEQRVWELEHILCPIESHQFKLVKCSFDYFMGETEIVYHYICQKCGKKLESCRKVD